MNKDSRRTISPDQHDAVIFDLDGVITRTARIHARAWKRVFDEFLARQGRQGRPLAPFDADADYRRYVDGKPRYDGVRSFLASRDIDLPDGDPRDPPTAATVCGIGNRKNQLFLELLEREGVDVYEHAVELVRHLREAGLRTAVISSSRNCVPVLESVGALGLFDAKVDGRDSSARDLQGKPAPDIFLAAAAALGVDPGRAVVVEDALAGVEAGRAGGFDLVVGVDRAGQAAALRAHGADVVVTDLRTLQLPAASDPHDQAAAPALGHIGEIGRALGGRQAAVFLDYDGTLTPIVERPELAALEPAIRAAVRRLAQLCPVAVISGRDLDDVRERVGLEDIHYAGSHGFDISGPGGLRHQHPRGVEALPRLDAAERRLEVALRGIEGALVERKRFSIAVHFRRVAEDDVPTIEQAVDDEVQRESGLRQGRGKKVLELRPDVEWDKGAAVLWLLDALGLDGDDVVPIYIGDDVTDEDAFRALAERGSGIGIAVLDPPRPTAAQYSLRNPADTLALLQELAGWLGKRP